MKKTKSGYEKEVWEYLTGPYNYKDFDNYRYNEMNVNQIFTGTDSVDLNEKQVARMYEIGLAHRDERLPIAIENFSLDFFFEDYESELFKLSQPIHPYRDDQLIYGLRAEFTATEHRGGFYVAITLGMHETHGDSGGYMDIASATVLVDEDGTCVYPGLVDEDAMFMSDYDTIHFLFGFFGYVWKGIQYSMIYKPEVTRVLQHRVPKEERDNITENSDNADRKRVVKVQRVITIIDDGESEITIRRGNHIITLPVWSVAGHWRTLKSGKRVWVKPHLKGKDRENGSVFCPKEYRFEEEDESCR